MIWNLRAFGTPVPKGSWIPVPCGRPIVTREGKYYRLRDVRFKPEESDRLAQWLHAVELAALEAGRPKVPLEGPFEVGVTFYLRRPKTTKYPVAPLGPPDLDKLQRAVGDFLTGVYYRDDSQIVAFNPAPRKVYATEAEPEGATIVIASVDVQKKFDI